MGKRNPTSPHKRALKCRLAAGIAGLVLLVSIVWGTPMVRYARWAWRRVLGGATVAERLKEYGPAVRQRLKPQFVQAGVDYPPAELALIGIKGSKTLELWARNADRAFVHVRTYPILAASGQLGPKLREGDRQVPEGLYRIESLNPNSMFHLALRVNYPNEDDRKRAKAEGRTDLGGDIMIHGSNCSVGCLAMGDPAAEDLFVAVGDTGLANAQVILTPVDFRIAESPASLAGTPCWVDELYADIRQHLRQFRHDTGKGK